MQRKNIILCLFVYFVYFKTANLLKKAKSEKSKKKYMKCFDEFAKNCLTFCENYCKLLE